MADYALFYNSISGDRVYDAEDFTEWLKPFFVTGVFNGGLQVESTDSMYVDVNVGYVNIGGKVRYFDEVTNLKLDNAHSTLNRIDNIIVRRNDTERNITIMVQKGTQSSNPVAPTPIRENEIYDLVLAQVYVTAAATHITQSSITDTRADSDLCGWVVATVKEIDFSQITAQWQQYISEFYDENQQEFNTWYEAVKEAFAEDVPGTLQAEIDELDENKADVEHTHTKSDITDFVHTHTTSEITDLPTIPTVTDTYSGTSSNAMSGKAVKSAIDALDVTTSGMGAGKTLKTLTETDGKIAATFQDISITKSQVSDFPSNMTPSSHSHGNIANGGTIGSDTQQASGDKLVIIDADNNKIARSKLAFTTGTSKYLREDGSFQTPPNASSGSALTITEATNFNISGVTFKIQKV